MRAMDKQERKLKAAYIHFSVKTKQESYILHLLAMLITIEVSRTVLEWKKFIILNLSQLYNSDCSSMNKYFHIINHHTIFYKKYFYYYFPY